MPTIHILIDYENVQPGDIALLGDQPCRIKVFLGPHQKKLPVDFVRALQPFGERAEYEPLETAGKNALDMAIAFALGRLSADDPSDRYFVISKDSDYDPLIQHLKGKKIKVQRLVQIAQLPFLKGNPCAAPKERVLAATEYLRNRRATMPASEKTLRSTLHAYFDKKLAEAELNSMMESLASDGIVQFEGTKKKVTYPFRAVTQFRKACR